MARRCSYLPLLLPQIRRHFSRWIGRTGVDERQLDLSMPWFSFADTALDWHYPVGLLYDLCGARERSPGDLRPWPLTVHFTAPPDYPPSILPFADPDVGMTASMYADGDAKKPASSMTLQSSFYASLKQADCLRFGTAKRMMNLTKAAQVQLWDALWTHNYARFWQVNEGLVTAEADGNFAEQRGNMVQRAPVRCYLVEPAGMRVVQWPIPIAGTTIGSVLELVEAPAQSLVMLHGAALSHETPLQWLAMNSAYADNFLHLVIVQ